MRVCCINSNLFWPYCATFDNAKIKFPRLLPSALPKPINLSGSQKTITQPDFFFILLRSSYSHSIENTEISTNTSLCLIKLARKIHWDINVFARRLPREEDRVWASQSDEAMSIKISAKLWYWIRRKKNKFSERRGKIFALDSEEIMEKAAIIEWEKRRAKRSENRILMAWRAP